MVHWVVTPPSETPALVMSSWLLGAFCLQSVLCHSRLFQSNCARRPRKEQWNSLLSFSLNCTCEVTRSSSNIQPTAVKRQSKMVRYNVIGLLCFMTLASLLLVLPATARVDKWMSKCTRIAEDYYQEAVLHILRKRGSRRITKGNYKQCMSLEPDTSDVTWAVAKEVTESPLVLMEDYHELKGQSKIRQMLEKDRNGRCRRSHIKGHPMDYSRMLKFHLGLKEPDICTKQDKMEDEFERTNFIHVFLAIWNNEQHYPSHMCLPFVKLQRECTGILFFDKLRYCALWTMRVHRYQYCYNRGYKVEISDDDKLLGKLIFDNPPFEKDSLFPVP